MAKKALSIAAAKGKLGVLTVGMGAVATTMIAGVEAVRKGIALPVGSMTQMGTIRLGSGRKSAVPKIKDFVPLANLNDLVFGGWDLFKDNAYVAAKKAGVLDKAQIEKMKGFLQGIVPMPAAFEQKWVKNLTAQQRQIEHVEDGSGRAGDGGHRALQEAVEGRPPGDDLVRLDGSLHGAAAGARHAGEL